MKIFAAVVLALGFCPIRAHAQAGTAIGELMRQSGAAALPEVAAPPTAPASSAIESGPKQELLRLAKCTGTVDGMPLTLEFLREHNAGRPRNKGVMNMIVPDGSKIEHKIAIGADDERGTQIELFAALDPTIKFAEFTIPKAKESRVTIYAIHFRANWATVDCKR